MSPSVYSFLNTNGHELTIFILSSDKLPDLPTSGRWLESEKDALARFLLPLEYYLARDANGQVTFDKFAISKVG